MTRRLPPFGPLIAFDAVARHRSFTRAAEELGVTQSAVSHQVRRLEDFLGVQLLKRLNPGVELSDDGTNLQGELATLLDGIAGLEPSLRRRPGRQTLRVCWLFVGRMVVGSPAENLSRAPLGNRDRFPARRVRGCW